MGEHDREPPNGESSWIANMIETQSKGKGVSISLDCQEEPREKFRLMTDQWDNNGFWQLQENSEPKSNNNGEGGNNDSISFGGSNSSGCRKSRERKGSKSEKMISLEVLRQHFAGSLKDAAKSIGVCPTTLKRICRQHGISRWPSRKIKKVGHSLKKLQGVINSVQGPNCPIQLDSFFLTFPELKPHPLMSSSTCSQSYSTSIDNDDGSSLANMEELEEDPKTLVRSSSQSHRLFGKTIQTTVAPTVIKGGGGGEFRVKATFGGEKIRFCMQSSWGFRELQQEIGRRFGIEDGFGRIDLKYLDDDREWVLLTCDADLEECIYVCTTSAADNIIRISLHRQVSKLNLNS